jgi:hypothetical protein
VSFPAARRRSTTRRAAARGRFRGRKRTSSSLQPKVYGSRSRHQTALNL